MGSTARIQLSPYQRDIWVAGAQFPELDQYTVFIYDRYRGDVDEDRLVQAMVDAARRTDAFRLRFSEVDGAPYQRLVDDAEFTVRRLRLNRESEVRQWLLDEFATTYDLTGDRLVDLVLLNAGESLYAYVRTHHVICDAWGLQLFLARVRTQYLSGGEDVPAPSFTELIGADAYEGSARHVEDREFFERALAGVEPALFARRSPRGRRRTARYSFPLERSLVDAIRERGESPFVVFSAAVALYLAKVHQVDEVVLGVPVLNRSGGQAKQTVGQFANTLPMRVDTRAGLTVDEVLSSVRQDTRALLKHQRLPLGDLARGGPLFDTTVAYLGKPAATPIPGVTYETVAQTHAHDQDVLAIWVSEFDRAEDPRVDLECATDVFDADFPVEAAARHIRSYFRALATSRERQVGELDPLSEQEWHDLVHTRNATDAPFPDDVTLPELFARQVERTPERVALVEPDGTAVTYAELAARVDAVAAALRALGVARDDRVAVLVERGPHLLPAVLGAQLAGGAYVPVDPTYPRERVRLLLEDSGAKVALVGDVEVDPSVLGSIGTTLRVADLPSAGPVAPLAAPGDLAYVIYTSGSTGRPKGVMVEHRSVVNRLWWMQRRYPIGEHDVLLQKTPTSFDVSVWELFWWGFTGARLSLLPPGAEKDPGEVLRAVERDGVTVVHFVPSMFAPLLDLLEDDPRARRAASTLRLVFCSGEALPPAQVARFNRVFGDRARLVNLYGPTEAAVDVSAYDCPPGTPSRVPIGSPIDNIRLHVLDRTGRPQPAGAPGELHIGGVGVARGYLNRPELTAERFVPDHLTGEGALYRTGDRARWLADGTIEYLGRMDDQVKIRGNRVEPGEVRDHVTALPGVREAVVVDRHSDALGTHLVAYLVADDDLDPVDLRARMAQVVPEHLIPAFFVRIGHIPLSPNGKLDRGQLPEVVGTPRDGRPRTAVEAELAAVWAEVLGVPEVGVHDNYFALGGDSIVMLRLRARAERRGMRFEPADLMRHPTVAELAGRLSAAVAVESRLAPFELVSEVDRPRVEGLADAFPVNRLSLGLLFHSSRHPDSSVYHDVFRYRFTAEWDERAMRRAFAAVVGRHPALRSSFDLAGFSEPLQLVHEHVTGGLEVVDLRGRTDAEDVIGRHVEQRRFHRYELDRAPLHLFAWFVREDALDLVLSFHHAILDGWSVANVIVELMTLYRGEPSPPAAPSPAWQVLEERRALISPETARYWADLLDGAAMTALDGFRAHEPVEEPRFASHRVDLPADLLDRVRATAAEHSLPVKSLVLAAHCLTLHLFSGNDTVVTGAVAHGRPDLPEADRMVGLFLNTVPVRTDLDGRTRLDVARDLFRQELDGHEHRRYPLSAIQQAHGGVLLTAFNYVDLHVLEALRELTDLRVWEETNFALFVNVIADPVGDGTFLRVDTDGRTITRDQAALIADTYVGVLRELVADPHGAVDFAFLAARKDVVPHPESLVDVVTRFVRQAEATPDASAVALGDERPWTYRDLERVSRSVATRLIGDGAEPGAIIGVALNRSPEMIAVIWGVLRAGLVCAPLDVSYPAHRLALILDTARPHRVIAHPEHAHVAQDDGTVIPVADITADTANHVGLPTPDLDDLALLLFTSGSTGRPKGVELTHRMWAGYTQWQLRVPSGEPGLRTLQFAPLSFDMSFQEIFSTLCGGGELRLVTDGTRLDPFALLRLLDRYRVQRVLLPAVAFQRLAEASNAVGLRPGALRVVVSSGEQMRITEEVRAFAAAVPGLVLENQYGPTETHQVTYHTLTGDPAGFPDLPPIGRPLDGVEVQVLDPDLEPVPVGVTGEIFLGGDCLARGYHRAPDLTRERFLPHPWREGARLYRTGDLGRLLPDGGVVWLGRADTQVKVRGFRIEPAEVELVIMRRAERHPGLHGAAVVARTRPDGDAFLAAFLTGEADGVDVADLAGSLRAELPEYMVPSHFGWLDAFPLTPSGKRDDAALRLIPLARPDSADRVLPRDEYERNLAEVFTELLDVSEIGVDDDFFTHGGTSLTAMRLVVTIEKRYGVGVPLAALIETPTVAGLAERLRVKSAVAEFDPLVPIRRDGDRPPLFLVHPLGGHVLCYLPIARHLRPDQPVYALQAAGSDQGSTPTRSIEEMAAAYLAAIRRVRPEGPYVLGGWSFGGFVAYEMARVLRAEDPDAVSELVLLDSITMRRDHDVEVTDDTLMEFFYWELVWFERSLDAVEPLPAEFSEEEKLDRVLDRAMSAGVLPWDTSRATVRRLYELFRANWRALIDYRPPVTDLDVTLLRADGPLPDSLKPMHLAAGTLHDDPTNGWQHWTTGRLDVVDVSGDHLVLMEEPHVAGVADAITALLSPNRAEGTAP
ncbi:non-ribosomal peptide synthetase [Umezawaea sp. Da 62-37]|uniref:non-ribosomal peptide synthetase n=1 Tax=Umezawaea sp. Da 62-37 TaxID=3075927 RepID=UPI0028F6E68B|nr:non-ribosomal peptide synthetase [Umezawaea sp. Da 62-37]WNV85393.1 amino acid adenylation domain-containing protein [Umezawaea sp. Da 62-37]